MTIKNLYFLPFIDKSLDQLGYAKQFTKQDFTSTYHPMRIPEGDKWKTTFYTRYHH